MRQWSSFPGLPAPNVSKQTASWSQRVWASDLCTKTHKVLYCSCTTSVGTILEYCTWTNWMIQSYVLNFNTRPVVFMCWFSVLRYTKMCVYLWASQPTAFGCGTLWLKISILIFRNNYNSNSLQFQCHDNSTDNKKTSHIHMATLLIILNGQSKFHSTSFYVVAYTQLHAHQLIEPLQLWFHSVCYITAHQ